MTEDKWVEKLTPSHRVEFLAVKEKVEQLLTLGYSRAKIWKALHDEGHLQMSLSQFRRYTEQPKAERKNRVAGAAKAEQLKDPEAPKSKRAQIPAPKNFKWNPNPLTPEEVKTGDVTSREY